MRYSSIGSDLQERELVAKVSVPKKGFEELNRSGSVRLAVYLVLSNCRITLANNS